MDGVYRGILVGVVGPFYTLDGADGLDSDWADFNIPTPFGNRVRNALNAEPRSVRLSSLVGAGGLWYGFGKTIMDMYVPIYLACLCSHPFASRLSDEQANEMSQMLTKVCTARYRDELTAIATIDVP